jgi:ATPase subunit of ABC transporter with duplicated ATPase domains
MVTENGRSKMTNNQSNGPLGNGEEGKLKPLVNLVPDSPKTFEGNDGLANFHPGIGKILVKDNLIRFDKVPLITPNGDLLITCLDLEVPSGTNVLVCGPNGCGKSSLFRILGELWPLWGGTLTKPAKGKLFYVPQVLIITLKGRCRNNMDPY